MNILSQVSEVLKSKKPACEVLKPLKEHIEKSLGKSVDTFSMTVDIPTNEITIHADNKSQTEKDVMFCFMVKSAVKIALKKKAPEFTKCSIHYNKDHTVGIALYLKDGSVQMERL
jgi:hypothetical protein